MKLLYLIANQPVHPAVVSFISKVARQTGSSLRVVAAASGAKQMKEIEAGLDNLTEEFAGLDYSLTKVEGKILTLFEEALEEEDYDMVVMGVHRRRRMFPSHFRLLSNRIIQASPIPIMLVRRVSCRFERMLICTGRLGGAEEVVRLSAKLAGTANMKATLLNVAGAVPSMYTGLEEMEETIEELLATETPLAQKLRKCAAVLTENEIEAKIEVRHGDVVEAILDEAQEGHYDLIVLGESGARQLRGMLMGNVTQQIINRAASAVLVYKQ